MPLGSKRRGFSGEIANQARRDLASAVYICLISYHRPDVVFLVYTFECDLLVPCRTIWNPHLSGFHIFLAGDFRESPRQCLQYNEAYVYYHANFHACRLRISLIIERKLRSCKYYGLYQCEGESGTPYVWAYLKLYDTF